MRRDRGCVNGPDKKLCRDQGDRHVAGDTKAVPGRQGNRAGRKPERGKSTVFNALTGLNQHTGNWPGKTVTNAQGRCTAGGRSYVMVDIPGAYSLMAHSAEEEVARNFICFGEPDAVVVVCDATCLERNLNLVLQTLEISRRVVVCVNLMDEAERKGIKLDLELLSGRLGVPVVGTTARRKKACAFSRIVWSGCAPLRSRANRFRSGIPTPSKMRSPCWSRSWRKKRGKAQQPLAQPEAARSGRLADTRNQRLSGRGFPAGRSPSVRARGGNGSASGAGR